MPSSVRPLARVPSTMTGLWPVLPPISKRMLAAATPDCTTGFRWIGTWAGALASVVKQAGPASILRMPAKPDQSPSKLQVPPVYTTNEADESDVNAPHRYERPPMVL